MATSALRAFSPAVKQEYPKDENHFRIVALPAGRSDRYTRRRDAPGPDPGPSAAAHRREERTLRSVRGRRAISDHGYRGSDHGRLAHAAKRVARPGIHACQHRRDTRLLGGFWTAARTLRLRGDRQAP